MGIALGRLLLGGAIHLAVWVARRASVAPRLRSRMWRSTSTPRTWSLCRTDVDLDAGVAAGSCAVTGEKLMRLSFAVMTLLVSRR